MLLLLYLIFFLSGAAALIFEAVWFHQAGLALGNSVWASTLVLAGFMGGLAVGNGLCGKLGHRIHRPLRFYALLEATIGISGLALVFLLPRLPAVVAPLLSPFLDSPWVVNLLRLPLAFLLLLAPSTAMGATLPVMVTALYRRVPHFGQVLGRLYGTNTLGAVAGVLAADMVLIGWLGIRGAGLLAALANLAAAAAALLVSRRLGEADQPQAVPVPASPLSRRATALLGAAFIAGGILLALEIVWFRFLLLFVIGNGLAFALMLAVVLAGIALGGFLGSAWLALDARAHRLAPVVALASGCATVLIYRFFDTLGGSLLTNVVETTGETLRLALPLMFPVSLLSGLLFTLLGEAVKEECAGEMRAAGFLTLANTTGAMAGALAGGFVLLPVLGMERSFQLLAAGYAGAAGLMVAGGMLGSRTSRSAVFAISALTLVVLLVVFPAGRMESVYLRYPIDRFAQAEGAVPVEIREGLTETIIYMRADNFDEPYYYRLVTNSFSMSATHFRSQRYMKFFTYLPVALHPEPKSALLLCYGVGITAKSLTDTRSLERIDVVDISRDVLEMNRIVYPDPAAHPLRDPRVQVHVEDARYFLQATDDRFDIITGEPPPPKLAGVGNLYTEEYFRLMRSRLADGGLATYWLPVDSLHMDEAKSIIRAFCNAFDDCTLWGASVLDWVLMGSNGATHRVSDEHFARQWNDAVVAPELAALALETPAEMGVTFIGGAEDLATIAGEAPALRDNHPKLLRNEWVNPASVTSDYRAWLDVGLTRERFRDSPFIARLWPAALRQATLSRFATQEAINHLSFGNPDDEVARLHLLHRTLATTELRTLPLLLMGSSAQQQQAAARAEGQGKRGPVFEYLRGLGALADRNYVAAAVLLGRAQEQGDSRRRSEYLRLFALCMAGRTGEAGAAGGAPGGVARSTSEEDRRVWAYLARTFSLPR